MQFLSNVVAKCTHSFAKSLSLAPLLSNHSFHLRFSGPTHAPPCFIKPSHPSQKHPHKRTTLSFVCPKVRTTSYSHQVICIKVLFSITDSSWLCQEEKKGRRRNGVLCPTIWIPHGRRGVCCVCLKHHYYACNVSQVRETLGRGSYFTQNHHLQLIDEIFRHDE